MSLALQLERATAGPRTLPPVADYARRQPLLSHGLLQRVRRWPASCRDGRGVPNGPAAPEAEVLVQVGDHVQPGDAVARYHARGRATAVDVAGELGLPPDRAAAATVRTAGEMLAEGEVLASRSRLGGLQRSHVRAPFAARIRYVSPETGIVYLEAITVESSVPAHLAGTVVEVRPDGVVIAGHGLAVAGIAGAGRAAAGILIVAETPEMVPPETSGAIVACGFAIDEAVVSRLIASGAAALVAAGVQDDALARLGWDDLLWPRGQGGPARPAPPLTLVLLSMGEGAAPRDVWDALRPLAGRAASALGAEPGAAPELVVSMDVPPEPAGGAGGGRAQRPLARGDRVWVAAGRAQGLVGEIAQIVPGPVRLPSEVHTGVADVIFPFDVRMRLPLLHLRRVESGE